VVAGEVDLGEAVEVEIHGLAPGRVEHAADPGADAADFAEAGDRHGFGEAGDARRFDVDDEAVERAVVAPERGRGLGVA
jgi:hypothetical protein